MVNLKFNLIFLLLAIFFSLHGAFGADLKAIATAHSEAKNTTQQGAEVQSTLKNGAEKMPPRSTEVQKIAEPDLKPKPKNFITARKVEEKSPEADWKWGIGYSFFGNFFKEGNTGNFSMIADFQEKHSFQLFFGIYSVHPFFYYSLGTAYRRSLSENKVLGLHLGGVVQLGTSFQNDFFTQAGPLFGIHLNLFQVPQLQLFLDGGALLRYERNLDFQFGALGNAVASLSLHYFF